MSLLASLTGELRTPEEVRAAVYLFGDEAQAARSRFWLLLILASVIASAGVLADSTATVIGAMIIAPLATPIHGVGVALAGGELRALLASARTLLLGGLTVVAIGAGCAFVLPELVSTAGNSQITGRTAPTLLDLVAAAATGLAGSLAIARRDIGDILPGVAIAISLVPPLAVVGVTASDGAWDDALGALLLFTTNVLAIVVMGSVLYSLTGLLPQQGEVPRMRPAYTVVAAAGVVVVLALAVATFRTVQLERRQNAATAVAREWAAGNGERLLTTRYQGDALVVVVEGAGGGDDAQLLRLLDDAVPPGTPVELNRVSGQHRRLGDVD